MTTDCGDVDLFADELAALARAWLTTVAVVIVPVCGVVWAALRLTRRWRLA